MKVQHSSLISKEQNLSPLIKNTQYSGLLSTMLIFYVIKFSRPSLIKNVITMIFFRPWKAANPSTMHAVSPTASRSWILSRIYSYHIPVSSWCSGTYSAGNLKQNVSYIQQLDSSPLLSSTLVLLSTPQKIQYTYIIRPVLLRT
jgi:hypothetical protein